MSADPSISELLRRAGYGHERDVKSTNTQKHRIFRLTDNETIGHMRAGEAVEFLAQLEGAANHASPSKEN